MSRISDSEICTMLGIRFPLFQGGMAWISGVSLAAAVSEAGGLGILTSVGETAESLRDSIRRVREKTRNPFGVNIMLQSPHVQELAEVLTEERVPVVTTGAGNPAPFMADWARAGIRVIPVVASVSSARLMERYGASAVIAEGTESGGHIGEITTLCLTPQIADVVRIPVIAAGGIGDGRGMAAMFLLGAHGVQVGTRFLLARECPVHEEYKKLLLKAKDTGTIVTGRRWKKTIRALKTPFPSRLAEEEEKARHISPAAAAFGTGALKKAVREGDREQGCFMAGQIAGMLDREQTARDIVEEIALQAEKLLENRP